MKKYLDAAAPNRVGAATNVTAANAQLDSETNWLLLGLDWENGAGVVVRDMPADIPNVVGRGPLFATQRACQAALRRVVQKYAGLSHAEGGRWPLPLQPITQLDGCRMTLPGGRREQRAACANWQGIRTCSGPGG